MRAIPPIQALRALDAAARHLSYSRAADELGLTPGAVSHHIAKLEASWNTRLFVRDGQRMILTNDGQVLAASIRQGLLTIADALDELDQRSRPGPSTRIRQCVTVSVLHGFASRWLLPRLADFERAHPEISVALRPTVELARLDGLDGVDVAVRYGQGPWGRLSARKLMPGRVFPVAAPDYLARVPVRTPADLRNATLLRKPGQPWRPWFAAAGIDWDEAVTGPSYDDAGLILEAAAEGRGVALARAALVGQDLRAGRLIQVTDVEIDDVYSWFLVSRSQRGANAVAVHVFETWLVDAAAAG
jgi:LysR family transcriptional regulator, glycine cleavage system transcriptional activator